MSAHTRMTIRRLATGFGLAGLVLCLAMIQASAQFGASPATTVPAAAVDTAASRASAADEPTAVNMSMEPPDPVDTVTRVTFTVYNNCAESTTYNFSIDGVNAGSVASQNTVCSCNSYGAPTVFTITDPATLATFPTLASPFCALYTISHNGGYVFSGRVDVQRAVTGVERTCIFDYTGSNCADLPETGVYWCDGGYSSSSPFTNTLADTDGDTIPNCTDPDIDEDGILNAADNCPFNANADQVDTDANGKGDACDPPDRDGDGILNIHDNCPDTANADQADTDHNGTGDVCQPVVVAVPWQGSEAKSHPVYSGGTLVLQASASVAGRGVPVTLNSATWDPGDGSGPQAVPVTNSRALELEHVYSGADLQPYTATITVVDSAGTTYTDTFKVQIQPRTGQVDTDMAIDRALWFLHKKITLSGDEGSWSESHGAPETATAGAVQAFEITGHRETNSFLQDPYANDVARGLRFLFANLRNLPATTQGANNPDSNGNGFGLGPGLNSGGTDEGYISGQVIDAFMASATPDAMTTNGLDTYVKNRKYRDIVADMLDGYSWGATDNFPQGGWEYNWIDNGGSSSSADASASHWWAIGVLAARNWGLDAPQWLRDQNWNTAIPNWQGEGDSCGYRNTGYIWDSGFNTTAACLIMMNADNVDQTNARFTRAEGYLTTNFTSIPGNFYAMYQTAKAMRTAKDGTGASLPITMMGGTVDWYAGFQNWLVTNQAADGHWDQSWGSPGITGNLATGWGIIILSSALFEQGPTAVCSVDTNISCAANALCGAAEVGQYANVNFDANLSTRGDNAIASYAWDFQDTHTADTSTVRHSFLVVGLYPVSLTVTDTKGHASTAVCSVRVTDQTLPPVVETGGPYNMCPGGTIVLDGSRSYGRGSAIVSYEWDWTTPISFATADSTIPTPGDMTAYFTGLGLGTYDVGLRLTDNTPAPDGPYTPVKFTTVSVLSADADLCKRKPFVGPPDNGIWNGRIDGNTFYYLDEPYPLVAIEGASVVIFPDCTTYLVAPNGWLFRGAPPAVGCEPTATQKVPVVTWSAPAAIFQGTPLSGIQLNATASVAGAFTYTPPSGTVLGAGNAQVLQVLFTPTDSVTYISVTKTVTIDVKVPNGFSGPTGTGGWSCVIDGNVCIYNGVRYAIVNGVVTFPDCSTYYVAPNGALFAGAPPAVNCVPNTGKTSPVVTWANPAPIISGTALSGAQLNATANVAGTFTYTPAAGTVLGVGNGQVLQVLFTPTDLVLYVTATKSVTIDVAASFLGPPITGVWSGTLNAARTVLTYLGIDYPVVGGVVTFPDCSTYLVAPNGSLFRGAPAAVGCTPQ